VLMSGNDSFETETQTCNSKLALVLSEFLQTPCGEIRSGQIKRTMDLQ